MSMSARSSTVSSSGMPAGRTAGAHITRDRSGFDSAGFILGIGTLSTPLSVSGLSGV